MIATLLLMGCWLGQAPDAAPAWLVVRCPPHATLELNGQPTQQQGGVRRFQSQPLPPDIVHEYHVTLRDDLGRVHQRTAELRAGQTTEISLLEPEPAVPNFGLDLANLVDANAAFTINGTPITKVQAAALVEADRDALLPDATRRRLTIIGSDADRRAVLAELQGPLKDATTDFVIRDYPPDHWVVARAGFVTTGHPTIYVQEADGTVLFRQDDAHDLARNLAAIRRPRPDYQPQRDPDYRQDFSWPELAWPVGCGLATLVILLLSPRRRQRPHPLSR